jgi:HK97 gp10 family phage protein
MADDLTFNPAVLATLFESVEGPVAKELERRAIRVEGAAKHLCPVDTGRLRASVGHAVGHDARGLLAVVGSDVEYAPYVELGTRNMAAQAFLRPALGAA